MPRRLAIAAVLALAAAAAAGLVAAGRATVDTTAARAAGVRAGELQGYADGVRDGHALGLQEGRALQATERLPAAPGRLARRAFDAGYAAGGNDVFSGYDGGWDRARPYVVTLVAGRGGLTYRIASRVGLVPGLSYFLCPGSHALCHAPRPRIRR